jgi:hypothetical protein
VNRCHIPFKRAAAQAGLVSRPSTPLGDIADVDVVAAAAALGTVASVQGWAVSLGLVAAVGSHKY